jgi:hypothetical protein
MFFTFWNLGKIRAEWRKIWKLQNYAEKKVLKCICTNLGKEEKILTNEKILFHLNTFSANLRYLRGYCSVIVKLGPRNSDINALQPSTFLPQHFWHNTMLMVISPCLALSEEYVVISPCRYILEFQGTIMADRQWHTPSYLAGNLLWVTCQPGIEQFIFKPENVSYDSYKIHGNRGSCLNMQVWNLKANWCLYFNR